MPTEQEKAATSSEGTSRTGAHASTVSQFALPISDLKVPEAAEEIVRKLMDFEVHFNLHEIDVNSDLYRNYLEVLLERDNITSFYNQLVLTHETTKDGELLPMEPRTALQYTYDQDKKELMKGIIEDIFVGIVNGAGRAIQETPNIAQQLPYIKAFVFIGHIGINFNQDKLNRDKIAEKRDKIRNINKELSQDPDIIKCLEERNNIRKNVKELRSTLAKKESDFESKDETIEKKAKILQNERKIKLVTEEIDNLAASGKAPNPALEDEKNKLGIELRDMQLALKKDSTDLEDDKILINVKIEAERKKFEANRKKFEALTEQGSQDKKALRREITNLKEEINELYEVLVDLASNPDSPLHTRVMSAFHEKSRIEYLKLFSRAKIYDHERVRERQLEMFADSEETDEA